MRSTVVRASKPRYCDSVTQGLGSDECTRRIERGDRYARSVVSPQHDDYGNEGWHTSVACLPCARRYPVTWPPELLAEAVAYELPDFHPETGHLHTCTDRLTCDCAAWLYCLAQDAEAAQSAEEDDDRG